MSLPAVAHTVNKGTELGYAVRTSAITGVTGLTLIDVPDLTTTVTVGARPIVVRFDGSCFNNTALQGSVIAILEDGVEVKRVNLTSPTANAIVDAGFFARLAPAAGSHTYKIQNAATSAGSISTVLAAASPLYRPCIQVVEC